MELQFILTHINDIDTSDLREQYYALRAHVFSKAYWPNYYLNGPDEFDQRANTVFSFALDGGKLIAGVRLPTRVRGSNDRMRCESHSSKFKIEQLLPHLNTKNLTYSELTAAAVDEDPKYRGLHLGTKIQQALFEEIKAGNILTDLVLGSANSSNATVVLRASENAAMKSIVREDTFLKEGNITRIIMMFSANPNFEFLSEEMKKAGIGTTPGEFIAKVRAERNKPINDSDNHINLDLF